MQEAAGRRRRLISFSPRAFLRLVIASDQYVAAVCVSRPMARSGMTAWGLGLCINDVPHPHLYMIYAASLTVFY